MSVNWTTLECVGCEKQHPSYDRSKVQHTNLVFRNFTCVCMQMYNTKIKSRGKNTISRWEPYSICGIFHAGE